MNDDAYHVWTPVADVPRLMHCRALHDDYEMFRVLLHSGNASDAVLRILFEQVISYRRTDESFRLKTLHGLDGRLPCSLMVVEPSSFIAWLLEESSGVLDGRPLVHYVIMSSNECIDVVSEIPPRVEWL
jgi:hypothetical protein